MDYGSLIQQSWRLTWRYRCLWVLGLFVPGFGASCSGGNGGGHLPDLTDALPADEADAPPAGDLAAISEMVSRWAEQNIGLLAAIAGTISCRSTRSDCGVARSGAVQPTRQGTSSPSRKSTSMRGRTVARARGGEQGGGGQRGELRGRRVTSAP